MVFGYFLQKSFGHLNGGTLWGHRENGPNVYVQGPRDHGV